MQAACQLRNARKRLIFKVREVHGSASGGCFYPGCAGGVAQVFSAHLCCKPLEIRGFPHMDENVHPMRAIARPAAQAGCRRHAARADQPSAVGHRPAALAGRDAGSTRRTFFLALRRPEKKKRRADFQPPKASPPAPRKRTMSIVVRATAHRGRASHTRAETQACGRNRSGSIRCLRIRAKNARRSFLALRAAVVMLPSCWASRPSM